MCYIHLFYSYNLASWLVHYILKKCLLNEQIHSYSMIFNSYLLLYILHSMIQKRYLNEDQGQPWRRNSHKIKGWLWMRLRFFKYLFWKVYLITSCLNKVGLTQIHISLKILLPLHNCLFWKTNYLLSNSQKSILILLISWQILKKLISKTFFSWENF